MNKTTLKSSKSRRNWTNLQHSYKDIQLYQCEESADSLQNVAMVTIDKAKQQVTYSVVMSDQYY